ncbi:6-bladed beta-propeller [Candidatus Desantisbacteria bacterium]|nr:6-bladed beta-propeller [Candidatus Desantisbacteria bacterium]
MKPLLGKDKMMKKIFYASMLIIFMLTANIIFGNANDNSAGDEFTKIITGVEFEKKLHYPTGVAVNSHGEIYINNIKSESKFFLNNIIVVKIQKYNKEGKLILEFGEKGQGDGKFNLPTDIAVDKDDNIYITDIGLHRVQIFSSKGKFIRKFGVQGKGDGELNMPFAIAVDDHKGNIYIADTGNNRISVFNNNGAFVFSFGREGSKEGEFSKPMDLEVIDKEIYVVDTGNSRIQVFNFDGKFLWKFGQPGSELEDFSNPKGISVDKKNGIVYISDTDNNTIKAFSKKSQLILFSFGTRGAIEGTFNSPQRSFIDKNGKLYITDSNNDRLHIFKPKFHVNDEASKKCADCHNEEVVEVDNKKTHPGFGKECSPCHKLEEIIKIRGVRKYEKQICLRCHEKDFRYRYLHGPIGMGECGICHNPHGSEKYDQLLERKDANLCIMCHDVKSTNNFVHSPIEKGLCLICHNPHGGNNPNYTSRTEMKLCNSCHGARFQKKYLHGPIGSGECIVCHDPHSSKEKFYLKLPESVLCRTCHKDIKLNKFTHKPVSEGKCLACHTHHESDFQTQLQNIEVDLCYSCHKEEKEKFNKKFVHAPLKQGKGECIICHTPHSSQNPFMLKYYFNPAFYINYNLKNFDLCNRCHNKNIAEDEILSNDRSIMITNFRNGDVNLHYKHVNQTKGRNCITCHNIHASDSDFLIQTETYLGGMMQGKITFTRTASGGKCEVGCHKPREYSRSKGQ